MNNLKSIKLRVEGRIFLADAWIHKIRNQPFYAPAYRSDIFEYVTQKALYDLRNENNITTILLLMSARQMTANKVYIIEQAIKGLTLDNERAVCCFLKEVKQEYDHLIDTFLPEPTSLLQLRCYLEAELLSGLRKPCYQDWSIHDLMKAAQPQEMDELLRVFQGASLKEQAALVKILCNLLPPEEQGSYEHLKFIGGWYRDNPDQTFKFSMHKAISYEEYAFLAPEEISVIWGILPLPLEVSHCSGKEWTAFYTLPDTLIKGCL